MYFFLHLQHVDGSFSVKPLKQKQIVSLNDFHVVLFITLFSSRDGNEFIIVYTHAGGPCQLLVTRDLWN